MDTLIILLLIVKVGIEKEKLSGFVKLRTGAVVNQ